MRGASRESLAQLLQELKPKLEGPGAAETGEQLLDAVSVLDSSAPLRRSLADTAVAAEAKTSLLDGLFGSRLGAEALGVLQAVAAKRWASAQEFVSGAEHLAVTALASAAREAGRLADTEAQLFGFGATVTGSHELQRAFASHDAPAMAKRELANSLVAGKVSPEAVILIGQAAAHPRGRRVTQALEDYAGIVASLQSREVAEVTVAAALSAEQEQQLAARLAGVFGRELVLNVSVDPGVLGGVRVRVGDEVIDDTVAGRLTAVRRKIAG
ncbi:F0F1 ATP synthase subunit delta [Sediminivirga luteola]|uniref:F0F1 ATP synthase subunit delta n=1 Tax=Sediminivirga luteola TaxID=1774748 RepID=UPI001F58CCC2|nr:F0F1 ATP synthase subunit delta [Sediminivirga luteola]MCI2266547.1 F0F1 ATP synthase subunit delta [Sediminivirga luteola]